MLICFLSKFAFLFCLIIFSFCSLLKPCSPLITHLWYTYYKENLPSIEKIDADRKIFTLKSLPSSVSSSPLQHSHQCLNMLYFSSFKIPFLFYSSSATIYSSVFLHNRTYEELHKCSPFFSFSLTLQSSSQETSILSMLLKLSLTITAVAKTMK